MRVGFMFVAMAFITVAAMADADDAKASYNNHCRTCHSLAPGDNRLGPSLHGVVGRPAGSLKGYRFSTAMSSSGVTWDAETLNAFIENPDAVVPGHGMKPYAGISDADIRNAIVAALAGD